MLKDTGAFVRQEEVKTILGGGRGKCRGIVCSSTAFCKPMAVFCGVRRADERRMRIWIRAKS